MIEFLKQILTGIDNQTFDVGRILAFAGGIAFIIMGLTFAFTACYELIAKGIAVDFGGILRDFGIGFGSMATGCGLLLKLKENSEPRS